MLYEGTVIEKAVKIGNNVHIGHNAIIGKGTFLAADVYISTVNHIRNEKGVFDDINRVEYKPVKIGKDCWIGTKTIILAGVTIGDNVTIGAGSVVTKNIPDGCLAAGNPAVVKKFY